MKYLVILICLIGAVSQVANMAANTGKDMQQMNERRLSAVENL